MTQTQNEFEFQIGDLVYHVSDQARQNPGVVYSIVAEHHFYIGYLIQWASGDKYTEFETWIVSAKDDTKTATV